MANHSSPLPLTRSLAMYRLLFLVVLSASASFAHAVSFDCTKVAHTMEKMVCANSSLGRLDDTLAESYKGLLSAANRDGVAKLKREQSKWLVERNKCKDVACLTSLYQKRIDEISIQAVERQGEMRSDVVDCIENQSCSPCDEGNGTGISDCGWAYAELEERRIKRLERDIERVFAARKLPLTARASFRSWQAQWRQYRDGSCRESNKLADIVVQGLEGIVDNGTDFHEGFCRRHANEARRAQLERLLEVAKEGEK